MSHRAQSFMVRCGAVAVLVTLVSPALTSGQVAEDELLLWDFGRGVTNQWGGQYSVFFREPSWARTYLDSRVHLPKATHALRITVHREAQGFCGVWLQFYSAAEQPRRFPDASPYRYLSFWAKGARGGESFDVRLADERHQGRAEPRLSRPIRQYLPQGLSTEWQEVLMPLADFPGLDLHRLAQLSFVFTVQGDCRFHVGDLALVREPPSQVQTPTERPLGPAPSARAVMPRALWVWDTRDLLVTAGSTVAQDRLFALCGERGIRDLYCALELDERVGRGGPHFVPRYPRAAYRKFLARAHRRGLTVEALLGTPEWAARENHAQALAAIGAVVVLNGALPAGARFDGVHFDVEPYLLAGYSAPRYQGQILRDFLEMIERSGEEARQKANLNFRCDVPAWFFPTAEADRKRLTVRFHGQEKTVGEHLTDLLDNVTIMTYRNQADGAGGIISLARPALKDAAAKGKRVVVGLETYAEPDTPAYFICGNRADEFDQRLQASELRHRFTFQGFRLLTVSDGSWTFLGLEAPGERSIASGSKLERALIRLAVQWGADGEFDSARTSAMLEAGRAGIDQSLELLGFEPFSLRDPEAGRTLTGFRTVRRTPRITTFHGLGREVFEEEASSALEWLSPYASFSGLAIHHYESWRALMGK